MTLFCPPKHMSSDNVFSMQQFHLCKECFYTTLQFVMGKESLDYEKGNPTLQDFLKTIAGDCKN